MTALVSIGSNIRRPGHLDTAPMAEILIGIRAGRWGQPVTRVRALTYKSPEQSEAKERLPYWTPAGLFHYRSAAGLVRHSGHVAIDLDNLGLDGATAVLQTAIADRFCKVAFRSATARGVRLIFACPECSPEAHRVVFGCVAEHVRNYYGIEPDTSGSDVARASFVSFDQGTWLNPSAEMLPGVVESATTHNDPLCVVGQSSLSLSLSEGDLNTLAYGLGESRAYCPVREDGTAETHFSLLHLGLDLVVRYRRHGLILTRAEIDRAFRAWLSSCKRQGLRFRESPDSYRAELEVAIRGAERKPWLGEVVDFWRRWTRVPEFPQAGSSEERLAWAIRQQCANLGTVKFFLSARDAATITGTTFKAANDTLHRLVSTGVIQRAGKRLHARHAQQYWLLKY